MKVNVDQNKCVGCGNCCMVTDRKVFDFNEDGLVDCIVKEVPKELEKDAKDAIDQCPVGAIEEVK